MTSGGQTTTAGIITKDSPRSFKATVTRLARLIEDRGMKVFVVVDQSAEARGVELRLRPTTLILFGNPATGTAVMDANPLAALDLPLKVLVWLDGDRTKVSYLSPSAFADRYGLDPDLAVTLAGVDPLTDALVSP
jgi:uncharacterized protein (DUF302 family)